MGTLTLSGANTYAGGTLVQAGTLAAVGNAALGTGSVEVAAGARLTLNRGVVVTGLFHTTLTLDDATTSTVDLLGTGVQDTVVALVIDGVAQAFGTYGAAGSGAQFTVADFLGTGELQVGTVVPEPSTWTLLLGVGAVGVLAPRLRRRLAV